MHLLLQPVPLTLKQATVDPHLHQRLLDTHGHVWVSFLWGHCSFLLGPCAYKVLFMPSKSLFPQSFVFWWFYGGVNGDHLQEGLCHTRSAIPIAPAAGTADPCLFWRFLDTHRQVWVSSLWGHCSFHLGSGAHKLLFVPSRSVSQSCISSGSSMVGLMDTSSKRAYAIPESAAPRAPAPAAVHC